MRLYSSFFGCRYKNCLLKVAFSFSCATPTLVAALLSVLLRPQAGFVVLRTAFCVNNQIIAFLCQRRVILQVGLLSSVFRYSLQNVFKISFRSKEMSLPKSSLKEAVTVILQSVVEVTAFLCHWPCCFFVHLLTQWQMCILKHICE